MTLPKVTNLTDLAALLRSIDNGPTSEMGFDMQQDFEGRKGTDHPCGTAACIGGWLQAARPDLRDGHLHEAVAALGCDPDEAKKLCWAKSVSFSSFDPAWDATPEQAARAVEILRDTGKCDWPRAMEAEAAA